jgi:hypothetical protein
MYGYDQELDIIVEVVKPRFIFGPDSGADVYFKTDVKFGIKKHGDMNFILYDQFFFETEFDFDIVEEIAYANFAYMNLKKGGDHPENRDTPEYNPESISAEDY